MNLFKKICTFCLIAGPGLVVMLADTDAGSLITAAQSGAIWGYKLIGLQIILIPILFFIQELTVRTAISSGKGFGSLIKEHYGNFWAFTIVIMLILSCFGAITTELVGLSGIGMMFNIPPLITVPLVIAFLIYTIISRSFRSVERCAILLGLFELIFVIVAFMEHPSPAAIGSGFYNLPWSNTNFLYLISANIGAVIMPWMVFYQQSALVDKKITGEYLVFSRFDTAIGAILTQTIMCSVIIITAATLHKTYSGAPLNTVQQISGALTPYLGANIGRTLFALGMLGASLVACIVVSLTAAWSIGEITGRKCSLEDAVCEAPYFYWSFIIILILGGLLVLSGINPIRMSVAIEAMNTLPLPFILYFLFVLAHKKIPELYRLKGIYAFFIGILLFLTAFLGLGSGIYSILV